MINKIILLLLIIFLTTYSLLYKNKDNFLSSTLCQENMDCQIKGLIEDSNCTSSCYKGWYIPYIFNVGISNEPNPFP